MNKIKLFRRMSSPSLQKISWLKIQRIQSFNRSMAHRTTNNWGSKLVSRWQWGQHWYTTYGIWRCKYWMCLIHVRFLCTINMWWVSKFSEHQNNTEASQRWEDKTSISILSRHPGPVPRFSTSVTTWQWWVFWFSWQDKLTVQPQKKTYTY